MWHMITDGINRKYVAVLFSQYISPHGFVGEFHPVDRLQINVRVSRLHVPASLAVCNALSVLSLI
jgi:hypothetical protein